MAPPLEGAYRFTYHPWLREFHDLYAGFYPDGKKYVVKKASQMGFTEAALNLTLWARITKKLNGLYLMPHDKKVKEFSQTRIGPCISVSPNIKGQITTDGAENVNVKTFKNGSILYIGGTNSIVDLKEKAVADITFDEFDECNKENVALVKYRQSGQEPENRKTTYISTPDIPGQGVDEIWANSTQSLYFFSCPRCQKLINLEWPRNFEFQKPFNKSRVICHICKHPLDRKGKLDAMHQSGKWIAGKPDAEIFGFQISHLYSYMITARDIAESWDEAQKDTEKMRQFYHQDLGEAFAVDMTRLTRADLQPGPNPMLTKGERCVMGVDINFPNIHVQVEMISIRGPEIIFAGVVPKWEDLYELMGRYGVRLCVVDRNPEIRPAEDFAARFPGKVYTADYNIDAKDSTSHEFHKEKPWQISLHRTQWMDKVVSQHVRQQIIRANNLPFEWAENMIAPGKFMAEDSRGNTVARYTEGSKPDHFFHAGVYALVARSFVYGDGGGRPKAADPSATIRHIASFFGDESSTDNW
jgi:hypothetical protein